MLHNEGGIQSTQFMHCLTNRFRKEAQSSTSNFTFQYVEKLPPTWRVGAPENLQKLE